MKSDNKTADDKKPLRKIKGVCLHAPGVLACGPYKGGVDYFVGDGGLTNEEAHRLIEHKGFTEIK